MSKKYILIFCLILLNLTCLSRELKDFDSFLKILAVVESSNNPKAYNKSENAIGIYQIRLLYFKDAQKFNKNLIKYSHSDCYSPEISKLVVKSYMLRYSNNKIDSFQTWAKMHNGGGRYWLNKSKKYKENLIIYWEKFKNIQNNQ